MRLQRIVLVAAAVGVAVGGCGTAAHGQSDGFVVGTIHFVGGPLGSPVGRVAEAGRVRLVRGKATVDVARVREGHAFRLSAPAGTYRLRGHSGDALCRVASVTVRAGATTHLKLPCDIR